MTENQLNKMFTNGPINMHWLFTMLGSSACKGTILYSPSPIITFWLNKQKWEGCSFLIMWVLLFWCISLLPCVEGWVAFVWQGEVEHLDFHKLGGVERRNKFSYFVWNVGHVPNLLEPHKFPERCFQLVGCQRGFTCVQEFSWQQVLSGLLVCAWTDTRVCRILFTAPHDIFSLALFALCLRVLGI